MISDACLEEARWHDDVTIVQVGHTDDALYCLNGCLRLVSQMGARPRFCLKVVARELQLE